MEGPGRGKVGRRSRFHLWKGKVGPGEERVVERRIHFVDRSSQKKIQGRYRLVVSVKGQELEDRHFVYE